MTLVFHFPLWLNHAQSLYVLPRLKGKVRVTDALNFELCTLEVNWNFYHKYIFGTIASQNWRRTSEKRARQVTAPTLLLKDSRRQPHDRARALKPHPQSRTLIIYSSLCLPFDVAWRFGFFLCSSRTIYPALFVDSSLCSIVPPRFLSIQITFTASWLGWLYWI